MQLHHTAVRECALKHGIYESATEGVSGAVQAAEVTKHSESSTAAEPAHTVPRG